MRRWWIVLSLVVAAGAAVFLAPALFSQPPGGRGGFGPGGPGGGPGGPGGPNAPDRKVVAEFDADGDGRLNAAERAEARKALQSQADGGGRGRGPGGRGGPPREPGKPGKKVSPKDVALYEDESLYDPSVLRTLFLEFENNDWEQELATFKPTDVDVPCRLTVDGKVYPDVGVSFRGASSFFMIPEGLKRSLNLSMDFVDKDQNLLGYRTLNLLNCNGDASMMSSALYSSIASQRIATPKVNFVKVVINGENWGIYCNSQQFNKDFLKENFDSSKGARWKVSGSPRGDGGLRYLGEDLEPYRERFEIKSKDSEKSWRDLIELCRLLDETPVDDLETALATKLDIDGALWFLAVDVALVNSDGYWTRASDYNIYKDPSGKFHVLPHDMNEALRAGGRPGGPGGGGPGGGGPGFGPPGGGRGFGPPPGGGPPGGGPPGGGPPGGGPPGGGPPGDGPPGADRPGLRPPLEGEDGRRPPEGRGGAERDERGGDGQRGDRQRGDGQRGGGPGEGPQRDRGGRGGFGGRGRGGFGGGPGGGGPGHGGIDLDPLIGLEDAGKPLRSKLLANEKLRTRYLQHVRTIAQDLLSWKNLGPQVAGFRNLIADEVAEDTRKLSTTEAFLAATSPEKPAEGSGQTNLRDFAEKRATFLLSHESIRDLPKEPVKLSQFGTNKAEEAVVDSLPSKSSPVVISEVMASNKRFFADAQGEFEDWIELHNTSDKPVELNDMFLSDDPAEPHKWPIPTGTKIEAGGYLIIWADNDTEAEGGLHANFKLSSDGERITLCSRDAMLSSLEFGPQKTGVSFGQLDDQPQPLSPTPGAANTVGR